MASTRKLIDDWVEAGLPRDQATKMALALDDHLESRVVDKPTLNLRMAELDKSLSGRMAELEKNLSARMAELERGLDARMNERERTLSGRMAELERALNARMTELERGLAALETRLLVRVIGLVVVQLGLFWAITRL